jgi:hypothetical protein
MQFVCGVLYINLERRGDRRAEIESECARMDLVPERFPAIAHDSPHIGCVQSHLEALQLAKSKGWNNVLIFEDDFQFVVSKAEFHTALHEFFSTVPSYDVLMLSYYLNKGEPYNTVVGRVLEAQTASGYLVHSRFYDALIENLETALHKLMNCGEIHNYMNDQYWKHLQPGAEWFYVLQRMGVQRESYSDLCRHVVNYGV